ncbi:MAG: CDP-diacylglycerol--serine O-phosphatidyltransferase [Candidatus Riflebacteria bacterium]|nr:CDP-diacylglycerol--serine O-phosphatidyltransferase [Candidatus Riflebacteria bacterium]
MRPSLRHLSILPSIFTSGNLLCGFLSIILTSCEEYLLAGWMIILAVIFDILDGRIARLTSVTSRFGAELDSLADLVSFGVAPAFLVFRRYMLDRSLSLLAASNLLGLFAAASFVLCGALRLARFNVTPPSGKDVFTGLPIPAGAGILCTLTIFEMQYFNFMPIPNWAIPIVVGITSVLMICTIEYPAMKKSPKTSYQRRLLVLFFIGALIVTPPLTLFFYSWGFAFYGVFMFFVRKLTSIIRRKDNLPVEALPK